MIKSMTGFGRGEYTDEKRNVVAEIKSVNHRYCEISVKMPRRYQFAEEKIKQAVKAVAPRGKIDVSIMVDDLSFESTDIRLNIDAAKAYYESLVTLKNEFPDLEGKVDLRMLATMPDVLKNTPAEEDEEEILKALMSAVNKALESYDAMKVVEGKKLVEDMLARNNYIEETVKEIEVYAPEVAKQYALKMKERIQELLGQEATIPEDRVLLEAAVFADKSNITEEIVRLTSHCAQFRTICSGKEAVGKKLDFLVQEMNRESNTIGSKANDIKITDKVLILKAEIEKIREQVQNLE
ncbi:MAG: YicC family protein [Clostridia bacterium]|nr:YicC family protein [Clostridia bacterium]